MRDDSATMKSLVFDAHWELEGVYNCCKCDIVMRLRGAYESKSRVKELRKGPGKVMPSTIMDYDDLKDHIRFHVNTAQQALPIEWAFTAVLHDAMEGVESTGGVLLCATDRVRDLVDQDCHLGPFSTRGFVRWLKRKGLADVSPSRIVQGIEGWFFELDRRKCRQQTDKVMAEVKAFKKTLRKDQIGQDHSIMDTWGERHDYF